MYPSVIASPITISAPSSTKTITSVTVVVTRTRWTLLRRNARIAYQVHAALPWLLYAVWPFSRLVHVWSIPFQYIGRPYILYRSRYSRTVT